MGMDVSGKNPTSKIGSYFRRNVWGWRPLWSYVEDMHPDIAACVVYGHSNDGDGLDAEDAQTLAKRLMEDVESGRAQAYVDQRDAHLASLPKEKCNLCHGTGCRKDALGIKQGMIEKNWCNGCDGRGEKEPFETWYSLDKQDLIEFADFLKDCGGFEIW